MAYFGYRNSTRYGIVIAMIIAVLRIIGHLIFILILFGFAEKIFNGLYNYYANLALYSILIIFDFMFSYDAYILKEEVL